MADGWMRRLRGAFGMGVAWGLAWFLAGMVLLLIVGPDAADVPFPLGFGAIGFLGGVTFSGVVGLLGRNRRFEELSIPRFAGWGALGGVGLSVLFAGLTSLFGSPEPLQALPFLAPLFGVAGAGCAAGALAVARHADGGPRLEAGDDRDRPTLGEGPSSR